MLTALHSLAHDPQLKGSTARSVVPVQGGGGPASTLLPRQVEAAQVSRAGQAVPQAPQFFTSTAVSVQTWLQALRSRSPGL
jgi:hypothetical protein